MSADNWAECPQCQRNALRTSRELRQAVKDAYGNVPEVDYLRMKQQAQEPVSYNSSSLREDYETYIDNDKLVFHVSYKASCEVCGFSFNYKYSEQVKL
jgi:hypothetical protein